MLGKPPGLRPWPWFVSSWAGIMLICCSSAVSLGLTPYFTRTILGHLLLPSLFAPESTEKDEEIEGAKKDVVLKSIRGLSRRHVFWRRTAGYLILNPSTAQALLRDASQALVPPSSRYARRHGGIAPLRC